MENNYKAAMNYFKSTGEWFEGCVLHHKDPSLRHNDPERYNQWNISDLVVMNKSDHIALHNRLRDYPTGEDHPMWGKHHTEESKEKNRQSNLGQKRSKEVSEHLSQALTGRKMPEGWGVGENNNFYGKKHSEETRKRISESRKAYFERKKAGLA